MKNFFQRTALVFVAVAMMAAPYGTNAGTNDIFKGWSWTPFAGWISMNSTNMNGVTGCDVTPAKCYGVTMDDSRNLTGYAWSPNMGWICFGSTCPGTAPGGGASWALLDPSNTPQLFGWARILSMAGGSDGWISLNCKSYAGHTARDVCGTSQYGVSTTTNGSATDGQFMGYAWNCATSDGSACTAAKYASGYGWIRFDPVYTRQPNLPPGTYSGVPWVQVLYGDLYSKGSISTPSPFTPAFKQVNATYCIDTGIGSTITRFSNDPTKCATYNNPVKVNISLPNKGSNYSNILGRIKLRGYTTDKTNGLHPINNDTTQLAAGKYGPWGHYTDINSLPWPPFDTTNKVLGGAVYDSFPTTGNWTMGARTFNNALAGGNGSGLLIVRGNLNITGNITYGTVPIDNLKRLASLGILVLDDGAGHPGNLTIDPSVTEIDANIYAEGEISTGSTGNPTSQPMLINSVMQPPDQPLIVNGVAVAKQFNFQRVFPGGSNQPSEQIVNDGRIVVNTPPGMNDFVASLPSISY